MKLRSLITSLDKKILENKMADPIWRNFDLEVIEFTRNLVLSSF